MFIDSFYDYLKNNAIYSKGTDALGAFAQLIAKRGYLNIDASDFISMAAGASSLTFGLGIASGENRATNATKIALQNAFLNTKSYDLRGVLVNITTTKESFSSDEYGQIADYINKMTDTTAGNEAFIKIGVMFDDELDDALKVLVIAASKA